MKEKNIIALLSVLLVILILRLFLVQNIIGNFTSNGNDNTSILVRNPFSVKKVTDTARDNRYLEDTTKSYTELYPDLYVDSIKPIIHVEEEKTAYLTFDDGPSSTTCGILDTLDTYDAKATFFVLGCTITEEGKECLKTMVEQGHTIGIHTYSHNHKKIYASVEAYLEDFYQDYQLIYDITGVKVNIFRFPWGSSNSFNKGIMKDLIEELARRGFTHYDWNVSAEDSVGHPTEYLIKRNILKDLERYNNPIILMHDASVNKITAKTLPSVIELLQDRGYDFDTVDHREPYQFTIK